MWHRVQGLSSWGRWDLLQPCKGLWLSFSCFHRVSLKVLQWRGFAWGQGHPKPRPAEARRGASDEPNPAVLAAVVAAPGLNVLGL